MKNWKTTLAGIAMICGAIGDIAHGLSSGSGPNWTTDATALTGGVGLIMAKDSTTHSTSVQVQEATVKAQAKP